MAVTDLEALGFVPIPSLGHHQLRHHTKQSWRVAHVPHRSRIPTQGSLWPRRLKVFGARIQSHISALGERYVEARRRWSSVTCTEKSELDTVYVPVLRPRPAASVILATISSWQTGLGDLGDLGGMVASVEPLGSRQADMFSCRMRSACFRVVSAHQ